MNWFEKHLHWTWLIAIGILFTIVELTQVTIKIDMAASITAAHWLMLPINGWILDKKGQSLWWLPLALILIWFPLVLSNSRNKIQKGQWYDCPKCSKEILYGTNPCPNCKCTLSWSHQGATSRL